MVTWASVRPNRRTTGTCDRRRASLAASLQSKMFQKLGRIIFIILLMNINYIPRKAMTNRPSTSYCFDISIFILKDLKWVINVFYICSISFIIIMQINAHHLYELGNFLKKFTQCWNLWHSLTNITDTFIIHHFMREGLIKNRLWIFYESYKNFIAWNRSSINEIKRRSMHI